jgi:hypothetical protein
MLSSSLESTATAFSEAELVAEKTLAKFVQAALSRFSNLSTPPAY